jgi:hypothetical protein
MMAVVVADDLLDGHAPSGVQLRGGCPGQAQQVIDRCRHLDGGVGDLADHRTLVD